MSLGAELGVGLVDGRRKWTESQNTTGQPTVTPR